MRLSLKSKLTNKLASFVPMVQSYILASCLPRYFLIGINNNKRQFMGTSGRLRCRSHNPVRAPGLSERYGIYKPYTDS